MTIDATFWVAISFFIFLGVLIYLKVPHRINSTLNDQINEVKKELDEAEKLKVEAKNLLSDYENKIDKSIKETKQIIDLAKKIIEDSKKKLDRDIKNKKQKFNGEIEEELKTVEKEIKDLKKSSISNINNIAAETSAEVIKQIIDTEVNRSNVSAVVEDIVKREIEKHI